jgi:phospholipase C
VPDAGVACQSGCPTSRIEHLVVIIQENHSFDSYFGHYCTAAAGSQPSCTSGPGCCEAVPATEPGTSAASPTALTDQENRTFNPDHSSSCELKEIHGGAMDRFVTGAPACSNPRNFAVAGAAQVKPYWDFAAAGALADRYFQPIVGATSANDMYFARAGYVFDDNAYGPNSIGQTCVSMTPKDFTDETIGDLLVARHVSWAFYAEGYQAMKDATGPCPPAPSDCASTQYPCTFDPSDVPFEYYPNFKDNPVFIRDYQKLATDVAAGTLPSVVFVKALGYKTEHPGSTISAGVDFVQKAVSTVMSSDYGRSTLVLVTYDEGGGYYDHVAPPPTNVADGKPYGTRVPLLAMGPFARKNFVSHVTMEHSSVVKFIEWNWLGGTTGQLGTRDATVSNLGSLLDPDATGTPVPEQ